MATLRRGHASVPWGAQVERMVWQRSQAGKPKRKRSDRPSLTYDLGWDWDGTRILFSEAALVSDAEDGRVQAPLLEDTHSSTLSEGPTVSLLDVARYQEIGRYRKSRCGDFEIIRIPKTIPIPEAEPDLWDTWGLGEWEKLDELGCKRTYSEVARGFVEGIDHPNAQGCSRAPTISTEDDSWDSWECL